MVLNACRYFGHTREYWWGALTWSLYAEIEQQLAEHPPADRLLAFYFAAKQWWTPPASSADPSGSEAPEAEIWECPFPETTE